MLNMLNANVMEMFDVISNKILIVVMLLLVTFGLIILCKKESGLDSGLLISAPKDVYITYEIDYTKGKEFGTYRVYVSCNEGNVISCSIIIGNDIIKTLKHEFNAANESFVIEYYYYPDKLNIVTIEKYS